MYNYPLCTHTGDELMMWVQTVQGVVVNAGCATSSAAAAFLVTKGLIVHKGLSPLLS